MSHTPTSKEQAQALKQFYSGNPPTIKHGFTFELTPEQTLSGLEFQANHACGLNSAGAIGGAATYQFTDTSLGQVQRVKCACGQSRDLTNYDEW